MILLYTILSSVSGSSSPSTNLDGWKYIADGNSYVQGNGYTPFLTRLMSSSPFNANGSTSVNFGVGGQTTLQMLNDEYSQVLAALADNTTNVLLVEEGGNDIYYGATVQEAFDHMKTYCTNAKTFATSYNINLKIIVYTKIHRNQNPVPNYNDKLDAYNALLLADTSFYDAVIRPDLENIFQTYSSGGYDGDQVHPNNTGQQRYADLTREAILSF